MPLTGFPLTAEEEDDLDRARDTVAAQTFGLTLEQFRALSLPECLALLARYKAARGMGSVPAPPEGDEYA
jgi:hypothetical protein